MARGFTAAMVVLWVISGSLAGAQPSAGGSLHGTVRDAQGAVLPGVTVVMTSPDAPGVYEAVSDARGTYRFADLPPGTYMLRASLPEFTTLERKDISIRVGLTPRLDLELTIGSISETVVVQKEAPLIESKTAVQAVNVSGDLQRALPITPKREWSGSLQLAPGIVGIPGSRLSAFYYSHGADANSNVTQMDGAPVSSALSGNTIYVALSEQAIADVQVKTGTVDASSPLGVGAIVQLATPTGTNRTSGTVSLSGQADGWIGDNNPTGSSPAERFVHLDASAGGPVQRDLWWLFGSYQLRRNRFSVDRSARQIETLEKLVPGFSPFDVESDTNLWLLKQTRQVAANHKLDALFQRDATPLDEVGPTDAGVFYQSSVGGNAASARLTSVWRDGLASRIAVSYNDKTGPVEFTDDTQPARVIHQRAAPTGAVVAGTGQIAQLDNARAAAGTEHSVLTVAADFDGYQRGWGGTHEWQFGLYLQPRIVERIDRIYPAAGFSLEEHVLVDPLDASAGTVPFHRRIYDRAKFIESEGRSQDFAFYLQDAWRPGTRLTLTAGVRVDMIRRRDAIFDLALHERVELGPRAGVNYALSADGRRVVRAAWGRVHESLANTRVRGTSTSSGFRDEYDVDLDGAFETTLFTPGASAVSADRIIDVGRRQPHVDEWLVGYQQQLAGQWTADVAFLHRAYRDRVAYIEDNGIYDGNVFVGYRNEDLNAIHRVTHNVWSWPVYNGLDVRIAKRSRHLQLSLTYTRQWRHLAGTWQPNDPASFLQPAAFPNDRGIGTTVGTTADTNSLSGTNMALNQSWRDHVFRLAAALQIPLGLQLATSYQVQSGPWSGPIVRRVSAPDPAFGPSLVQLSNGRTVQNPLSTTIRFAFPTRGEGQFRIPAFHQLNLRLGKSLRLAERELLLSVDIFNVLNGDRFLELLNANQLDSPNFGLGTGRQLPRSASVSASLKF